MIDDPIARRILAEEAGKRLAAETLRRIERALDQQNARGTWYKLEQRVCDICFRRAVWAHPAGGVRCNRCPRPSK